VVLIQQVQRVFIIIFQILVIAERKRLVRNFWFLLLKQDSTVSDVQVVEFDCEVVLVSKLSIFEVHRQLCHWNALSSNNNRLGLAC
jgi:hypothetical protein